jgi:hypothetical protein
MDFGVTPPGNEREGAATPPSSSAGTALDQGLRARPIDVLLLTERARRVAFGAGLLTGAVGLVMRTVSVAAFGPPHAASWPPAWQIVLGGWLLAFGGWAALGPVLGRVLARHRRARAHDDWLAASLVFPAVGMALLLPLSLHMPFALLLGGASGFDAWSSMSMVIVGHAHVLLAILTAKRALALVRDDPARSPGSIYLLTIVAAAVPFGIFYAIPPILVALTGVPLLALLQSMEATITRERLLLADTY